MFLKKRITWNRCQKLNYCTQKSKQGNPYSNTVFLPKTRFPLRLENDKLRQRDEQITGNTGFAQLYNWQRSHLSEPEFVLHDGPPYANGKLHMGHAINKILKDTILRYEMLKGNKVHYVPGWDCHGLPIELKALSASNAFDMDPLEIRTKAHNFAKNAIKEQMKIFQSWGVVGDWNNYYATYTPNYYKIQLKLFHKLFKKKLIYRDVKPVFWSPSTRTALAEAELEYNPNFKSPSIFVRFKITKLPPNISHGGDSIYALIWTTTPWTLPSNQAVCYNPSINYCIAKNSVDGNFYIIASDLASNISDVLQCNLDILQTFPGSVLSNFTYSHPLYKNNDLKFLPASHVTLSKGTGLVHTAPAHGPDDFLVALKHKIPINNVVNELGCFTDQAGSDLAGKFVLREGTDAVLEMIKNDLIHSSELLHSYPCDWRTKEPVIIRASHQWFIDTNALKSKAVEALEHVKIIPKSNSDIYKTSLINQIQKRPYWCISRQRKWGVPIPVFYDGINGQPIINDDIITHLCHLIDNHGTDFWWKLPVEKLIPSDLHDNLNIEDVRKSQDILDIWFDSGISWSNALEGNKVADMYLEGIDQFNGWFQSALLTSVALRNKAPYRTLYVHGFAVDEKGMKMSKSLGNVVDPLEIVRGSKNKKAYGIDTLRWWVACHANKDSIAHVSDNVLRTSSDEVQKIRSILRFSIASLEDYDYSSVDYSNHSLLNKYMLHLLHAFNESVVEAVRDYQFHQICIAVNNFLTNYISALYYTGIKDKLYCDSIDNVSRRAVQYVLWQIFEIVTQAIAPIVPHLAEELFCYLPNKLGKTYFTASHPKPDKVWKNPKVAELMDVILSIRRDINKIAGTNATNSLVTISLSEKLYKLLEDTLGKTNHSELEDILQVSEIVINKNLMESPFTVDVSQSKKFLCSRCRRVQSQFKGELCTRCLQVINNLNGKVVITN